MKTNEIIENILRDFPETRNSDKELMLRFWAFKGFHLSETQTKIFKELPSTESVRRVRQKIQEEGRYPASEKIKKSREVKSWRMQQIAPKASPKYIEQVIDIFDPATETMVRTVKQMEIMDL